MQKAWFMAHMNNSPNGKHIMAPMKYILIVYNPNGKAMVL